jgi:hypothetical protein
MNRVRLFQKRIVEFLFFLSSPILCDYVAEPSLSTDGEAVQGEYPHSFYSKFFSSKFGRDCRIIEVRPGGGNRSTMCRSLCFFRFQQSH